MRLQKIAILALLALIPSLSFAKDWTFKTPKGLIILPESSQQKADKTAATTDLIISRPTAKLKSGLPQGETPASLACVYGLTPPVPGCNQNIAITPPTGGSGAIALVDAYYNPYAMSDLNTFSTQFGLPLVTNATFQQFYAAAAGSSNPCSGTQPSQGWWDEQVLDIEMAHAMSPGATLYLVEAQSFYQGDMQEAIACANQLVTAAGGGVVSMSWSYPEFSGELAFDSNFTAPGIVYISSSGDYGIPARYPSSSPNVISAGGSSIQRDANGNFTGEVAWSRSVDTPPTSKSGSSGGPSLYEPRPSFQNVVQRIVGSQRGTPDIAFNANFQTGNIIYSTYSGGWLVSGGTSSAAPALAGIINTANHHASSSQAELSYIYRNYPNNYRQYWHDIISGSNGYPSMTGYDFVTGLGTPLGYLGK